MAVECCEEASHALLCILACFGCKQYADRFKLEPTWTYFLSLFWPVLDVIGDILFLFTELMSASTALALSTGPVPVEVLCAIASVSIVVSILLICWRVRFIRWMHEVGYDLTGSEVLDDEEEEVDGLKGADLQLNPLTEPAPVDMAVLNPRGDARIAAEIKKLIDEMEQLRDDNKSLRQGRGRKDTAYVLEHANIKKMKKNAARVAKLVKGERQHHHQQRALMHVSLVHRLTLFARSLAVEKRYAFLTFFLEDMLQLAVQIYVVCTTKSFNTVTAFTLGGTMVGALMAAYRASKLAAYAIL